VNTEARVLVSAIACLLAESERRERARRSQDQENFSLLLESVVIDLAYHWFMRGSEGKLHVSRSTHVKKWRYRLRWVSWKALTPLLDRMTDLALIVQDKAKAAPRPVRQKFGMFRSMSMLTYWRCANSHLATSLGSRRRS
jgi:hypothetical protein